MDNQKWITPFWKQCFVSTGVSINLAQFGFVLGFTAVLLPQLRAPDSSILINDSSGSWIAAVPGLALVVGNFTIPTIMGKYGRKIANFISIIPMIVGWICITTANSVYLVLIARFLQGVSLGMSTSLGPILVGEYTSPKNRGAFLTTMSLVMAIGTLIVHAVGSYLSWQQTALLCTIITFIDLLIVLYSPESPSWLADQGKYNDCRKVFRWLRGNDEDEELEKMIEASKIVRESKTEVNISQSFVQRLKVNLECSWSVIKKKEFFKPIIVMVHIYTLGEWAGINILSPYILDVVDDLIGNDNINVSLLVMTVDAQRIIMNVAAVYFIKKLKRRTILISTTLLCIIVLLSTAGYKYAIVSNWLAFNHPSIGVILIHVHMFTIATGSVPLSVIISGEIFPIQYKSLSGAISAVFFSFQYFVVVKTFPFFCKTLGLHGTYILYSIILAYCLLIAWLFLPETKDRTLLEIEEEFRGRPLTSEELRSAQSLMKS